MEKHKHNHVHEHHNHEGCFCGHEHNHEEHQKKDEGYTEIFSVEGLDCAVCAARLEDRIRSLDGIEYASLSFASGKLKVRTADPAHLAERLQKAADSVEEGVTVTQKRSEKVRTYTLEGLCCAGCGAKIEAKVAAFEGVDSASLVFASKQLKVYGSSEDLTDKIQKAADLIEDGIRVTAGKTSAAAEKKEFDKDLIAICTGGVLLVAGIILEHTGAGFAASAAVLAIAYLLLGGSVLLSAGKNIIRGQIFDENFLMSIATLGAFGIGDYPEAVGVMLFYRIGEYFEERAVNKSRASIMEAVDLRPETVSLVEGDDIRVIPAEDANAGDFILVRAGDRIPLDGVIVSGESRIDTSTVTGEHVPVLASEGDEVISGCVNTSGQLEIRVTKPLSESMVTRILDSVENAAANKPHIDRFITRFARIYTPAVVGIALVVAFVLPFVLPEWHFFVDAGYSGEPDVIHAASGTASVFTALTFLVISCPCALVLSVPLAFFSGIGAASKKGILFKGGTSIETLSSVKAVVMDKTGTVTKGAFSAEKIVPVMEDMDEMRLLYLAASAEYQSTHPIGKSITERAVSEGIKIEKPVSLNETAGYGIIAETADGTILCGNQKLMEQNGIAVSEHEKTEGATEVFIAQDGRFAGYIVISDIVKEDAAEAVRRTRALGGKTFMLTGDGPESAEAVRKQTGIDEAYSRLLPEDKLAQLERIRDENGRVLFVGDGINDAPVLAGADVGAAMGSGADAAIEAADVVFMTSEVSAIPDAIEIAKKTRNVSWANVVFALAVKAAVMAAGLAGFANMWLAVFADTGVALICLLNSVRLLK